MKRKLPKRFAQAADDLVLPCVLQRHTPLAGIDDQELLSRPASRELVLRCPKPGVPRSPEPKARIPPGWLSIFPQGLARVQTQSMTAIVRAPSVTNRIERGRSLALRGRRTRGAIMVPSLAFTKGPRIQLTEFLNPKPNHLTLE